MYAYNQRNRNLGDLEPIMLGSGLMLLGVIFIFVTTYWLWKVLGNGSQMKMAGGWHHSYCH